MPGISLIYDNFKVGLFCYVYRKIKILTITIHFMKLSILLYLYTKTETICTLTTKSFKFSSTTNPLKWLNRVSWIGSLLLVALEILRSPFYFHFKFIHFHKNNTSTYKKQRSAFCTPYSYNLHQLSNKLINPLNVKIIYISIKRLSCDNQSQQPGRFGSCLKCLFWSLSGYQQM